MIDEKNLKRLMSTRMRELVKPLDGTTNGFTWDWELFDKLVDASESEVQPPARIEAATKFFREQFYKRQQAPYDQKYKITSAYGTLAVANLCKYFLRQEQDTWTDKDFGLEETKT